MATSIGTVAQAQSATEHLVVGYHETVDIREFGARNRSNGRSSSQLSFIHFSALGRSFQLDLTANTRLMAKMPKRKRDRLPADFAVFRGKLAGVADSWVRVSKRAGQLSGMIWDGNEFIAIEPTANADRNRAVVFRLADTYSTASCAASGTPRRLRSARAIVDELRTGLAQVTSQLNISIVADADFVAANSADPTAAVLARMNLVEGIYAEQVGVQLNITDVVTLASNPALSSTDPSTLLRQFAELSDNRQIPNPGLSHLFTGRDLNGNTVGIAFIGTLCRRYSGVGVSQVTGSGTRGALTVAHELGHNFGAPHDNQSGSVCASTPSGFLMNPSLNGSDQFSQCSLQVIQGELSGASCLVAVAPEPAPPPPPPDPVPPVSENPGRSIFSAGFDIFTGGFSYFDNIFQGSDGDPAYASGQRLVNGGFRQGAVNVLLGGRDNNDIFNFSGGWRRTFTLDQAERLSLSLRIALTHAANYESDEYAEALVSVNGQSPTRLARITGDGNGGPDQSTGYRKSVLDLGVLPAGVHTITIGAYSNKKTWANEVTELRIDDVNLIAQ